MKNKVALSIECYDPFSDLLDRYKVTKDRKYVERAIALLKHYSTLKYIKKDGSEEHFIKYVARIDILQKELLDEILKYVSFDELVRTQQRQPCCCSNDAISQQNKLFLASYLKSALSITIMSQF